MQIILTHEQADFDALGALLGAALLNEKAAAVLPRRVNRNVRAFLTLYGEDLPFVDARDLPGESIEAVTLVDTQSLITLKGINAKTQVHVVDHHQKRSELPVEWNLTGERVGACTTLLVENLRDQNGGLNWLHATLMLLGIYEDTGSLTYVSTTPRDVRAAAFLLESGASLRIATSYLNPPLSAEQRALYDRLQTGARTLNIHGQRVMIACADAGEMGEEISSVAHKLRDLLDPDALFLIINTVEGMRLVGRSTSDRVNVAKIAAKFGGGGHERAAAALIKTPYPFPVPEGGNALQEACREVERLLVLTIQPSVTVGEIMSGRPRVLSPQTSAQEAGALMQRYGYEGYPVVDDGKVVGLLTRRAVDRALAHKLNLPAASLMEAGEVAVHPEDSIEHLQRVMISSGWGQVPVVDAKSERIIGIATRTDLLKTMTGESEALPGKMNLSAELDGALPAARLALLKEIAAQARELRTAVYVVGGFVRDLVLDLPSLDFDVVVEGDAITLAKALAKTFGGRIVAHGRFGTAKWWTDELRQTLAERLQPGAGLNPTDLPDSLDLISARTEFYDYPTALPVVERSSIKLDLHRRDFTINTMAIRLDGRHYGDLYDYWGGLNDLKKGLVRVLHSLSFVDDPTRMLRAVRFEQRFGFSIEARTLKLMADAHPLVKQLSGDRLRHELDLILGEPKALEMLARLHALRLLEAIHPQLKWEPRMAVALQAALFERIDSDWSLPARLGHLPLRRALAYLTWFLQLEPEGASAAARLLRLPAHWQEMLSSASEARARLPELVNRPASEVVQALESVPLAGLYALNIVLEEPDQRLLLRRYAVEWSHIQPRTDGKNLLACGIPPGPAYRQILSELRRAWLDGDVESVEEEEALLSRLLHGSASGQV